ncbi:MAG: hypothetical protein BWK73_10825 [Thiothrix lacustris]|uniref:Type II toxin-antitoxin system PemK/MazF family toxin n=1 Tax=Thiothrix lacustris TaxID=525917 RepID=A0A1Y1QUB4_9GAMM|nr:MAG: hypothetical protein BWK73_10825 [Thiothrix lacustris]
MPIQYHPKRGQVLMCDFSEGFKPPEMVKNRPVIVFTPEFKGRSGLVSVVPLSTRKPAKIMPYHYQMPQKSLPMTAFFYGKESWVKGDLIYTVGLQRLSLISLSRKNGKRDYYSDTLDAEIMLAVDKCVLHGLGFARLANLLDR